MRCVCAAFALLLTTAATSGAQENSASRGPLFMLASASPTRAPVVVEAGSVAALRRRVSLSLDGVQVTDALAEIARAAGLQIVFADGVVPATARVHLRAEEITVAAALTDVLLDARVDVVLLPGGSVVLIKRGTWAGGSVAGHVTDAGTGQGVPGARVSLQGTSLGAVTNDSGAFRIANVPPGSYTLAARRIGYEAWTRSITVVADQETKVDPRLEVRITPLDAVVVTGTIVLTEQKALPNPITVISAGDIERRGITQLNELFRGEIPGLFTADYGESGPTVGAPVYVRGTTTLSPYSPALKTYIDGIEVADPEFLNQIDPAMIDHVEIVRGPQASTLYGAQAINGVMQVFTKKGHLATPARLTATLGVGALEGAYGTGVRHQDNVSVNGGTGDVSYNVGATYQHDGAWTRNHHVNIYGGYGSLAFQPAGTPVRVDVTARLGWQDSQTGGGLGLARAMADGAVQLDPRQLAIQRWTVSQPQQTLGTSVEYAARPWWVQTLTLGIDRGASGGDQILLPSFVTPGDSFTVVQSAQDTRTTAAYHSAFDWHLGDGLSANVVVGADRWDFRSDGYYTDGTTTDAGSLGVGPSVSLTRERDHDTGVFGQAMLGVRDALFLTAGLRVDEGPALPAERHHRATAPRVGASYVFDAGPFRAKVRAGYGSALRPATPDEKRFIEFFPTIIQLASPNLLPERQTGWDGGFELYAGDRASLSVTRYRQLARDLIAQVYSQNGPITQVQFLNIARVRNTGWELEGSLNLPAGLGAKAIYSQVESIVDALAPDDQTGYHVGDALPGVPHHTGALTLSETARRLAIEAGVSYVGTSANYDQAAWYHRAYTRLGTPNYDSPLDILPAAYRLALRASYDLTPHLTLLARCENLTNRRVVDQGAVIADQLGRTTVVSMRVH